MKHFVQILAVFAVLFCSSSTSYAASFYPIPSTSDNDWIDMAFDESTIRYGDRYINKNEPLDKTKITCWIKLTYSQEAANDFARTSEDDRFRNLDYILLLVTFSFFDYTSTIHSSVFYDHYGKVFFRDDIKQTNDILPNSRMNVIYEAILRYQTKFPNVLLSHTQGS